MHTLGIKLPNGQQFSVVMLYVVQCGEGVFTHATRSIARLATATWLTGWLAVCHTPVLCLNG